MTDGHVSLPATVTLTLEESLYMCVSKVPTIVWDWADGVKWDVIGTKDLQNWITVATNLTTNRWRFTNASPHQFYRIGASLP